MAGCGPRTDCSIPSHRTLVRTAAASHPAKGGELGKSPLFTCGMSARAFAVVRSSGLTRFRAVAVALNLVARAMTLFALTLRFVHWRPPRDSRCNVEADAMAAARPGMLHNSHVAHDEAISPAARPRGWCTSRRKASARNARSAVGSFAGCASSIRCRRSRRMRRMRRLPCRPDVHRFGAGITSSSDGDGGNVES